MDVRNCRSCGRLFNYLTGIQLCDGCKAALEQKFQEVKEYVRDNRDAPINAVAEACDVSVKQLRQWVREERGAAIRMGRFCESCKSKLQGDLRSAYVAPQQAEAPGKKNRDKDKMRFLDK